MIYCKNPFVLIFIIIFANSHLCNSFVYSFNRHTDTERMRLYTEASMTHHRVGGTNQTALFFSSQLCLFPLLSQFMTPRYATVCASLCIYSLAHTHNHTLAMKEKSVRVKHYFGCDDITLWVRMVSGRLTLEMYKSKCDTNFQFVFPNRNR